MKHTSTRKLFAAILISAAFSVFALAMQAYAYSSFIFPDSAVRYLTEEDVANLSLQEICYAKNEIYARRGRCFLSQELNDYFQNQDWYYGTISPSDFNPGIFNQYESANADYLSGVEHRFAANGYILNQDGYDVFAVLNAYEPPYSPTNDPEEIVITNKTIENMLNGNIQELGTFFNLDLNGDGIEEEIEYVPLRPEESNGWLSDAYTEEYAVYVDGNLYEGKGVAVYNSLYGISLDGITIQLILQDSGPSDDPICTFLRYENGQISKTGEIEDWINSLQVEGSRIFARIDCRVIETARMETIWEYQDGSISQMPQDFFPYVRHTNDPVMLTQPITVYKGMDFNAPSAVMYPQQITFTHTDGHNWMFIIGEDHEDGWVYFNEEDRFHASEYFSGLLFAD